MVKSSMTVLRASPGLSLPLGWIQGQLPWLAPLRWRCASVGPEILQ